MAYIYGSRAQAVTKAYALSKYDGQTRYAVTAGNGDHDVVCPAKTLASVVARWLPNSTYFYVFAHLYGLDKAAAVGMIDTDTAPSTWASQYVSSAALHTDARFRSHGASAWQHC